MILEKFRNYFNKTLDIIFPENCNICNKMLSYPECTICENCLNLALKTNIQVHKTKIKYINKISYITKYKFFSKILMESKINLRKNVLIYFLNYLKSKELNFSFLEENLDYIVPVPLSKRKFKDRGFNQSKLISEHLFSNSRIQDNMILKNKLTKEQKTLSKNERLINLKNAFKLKNDNFIINKKKILLVDDVITTGSTISEIGKILKENGCEEVNAFSLFIV